MGKMAFHEIESTIRTLLEAQDEAENPNDPEFVEALDAALGEMGEAEVAKIDGIFFVYNKLLAEAATIKKTAASLQARAKSTIKQAEDLKERTRFLMVHNGVKTIKADSVTATASTRTTMKVDDPEALPAEMKSVVRETVVSIANNITVDKEAVKKALDAGEIVPGAKLATSDVMTFRAA